MFVCEFWEISKDTFSYRTPPAAASAYLPLLFFCFLLLILAPFHKSVSNIYYLHFFLHTELIFIPA